jgi:hypothetical protein
VGISNELYALCLIKFIEQYKTQWDNDYTNCWGVNFYTMINGIDNDYFKLSKKNIIVTIASFITFPLVASKINFNLRHILSECGVNLIFTSTLDLIDNSIPYETSKLESSSWLINKFWENKPIFESFSNQRPVLLTAIALANSFPKEILLPIVLEEQLLISQYPKDGVKAIFQNNHIKKMFIENVSQSYSILKTLVDCKLINDDDMEFCREFEVEHARVLSLSIMSSPIESKSNSNDAMGYTPI